MRISPQGSLHHLHPVLGVMSTNHQQSFNALSIVLDHVAWMIEFPDRQSPLDHFASSALCQLDRDERAIIMKLRKNATKKPRVRSSRTA